MPAGDCAETPGRSLPREVLPGRFTPARQEGAVPPFWREAIPGDAEVCSRRVCREATVGDKAILRRLEANKEMMVLTIGDLFFAGLQL